MAASDRAAELAGAQRWTKARAVVDGARRLVAESPVIRRNASPDRSACGGAGVGRLSEDTLIHYVFAGSWVDAVDAFRYRRVLEIRASMTWKAARARAGACRRPAGPA